jgi:hypothetical protein
MCIQRLRRQAKVGDTPLRGGPKSIGCGAQIAAPKKVAQAGLRVTLRKPTAPPEKDRRRVAAA